MDLNNRKITYHPPSPRINSRSVTSPFLRKDKENFGFASYTCLLEITETVDTLPSSLLITCNLLYVEGFQNTVF